MQSSYLSEEESHQKREEQHSSSQRQSHKHQGNIKEDSLLNSQPTRPKHKAIKKDESKGSKASKGSKSQKGEDSSDRSKDDRKMGRPNKDVIDRQHTALSKQFNDIIYCSSRFLIFFHLMKGKDDATHALTLTSAQNDWMSQADQLMRLDNFPSMEERSLPFLLHPNSLHFIIHYNKTNKNESIYHPQRLKYYLFAFLARKNLLTRTIWMYVSQYWADIILLVINQQKITKKRFNGGKQQNYIEYESEEDNKDPGTVKSMREELQKDHSIAAYEIACYLWACCQHFKIQIRPN